MQFPPHSTNDFILRLHTNLLCYSKNHTPHLFLIELDLEKSYNMVWRNRILRIIQKVGQRKKCS